MKKTLSIILIIAMVLSMSSMIFADTKPKYNYVSLGSSQTYGFGLPGQTSSKFENWTGTKEEIDEWNEKEWGAATWNPDHSWDVTNRTAGYNDMGFMQEVSGSFPSLMKEYLEDKGYDVNFTQLATSAFRADDILPYLYEDYPKDYYSQKFITGICMLYDKVVWDDQTDGESYVRETYQNALKNADLITYDLGTGNFGISLSNALCQLSNGIEYDFSLILNDTDYSLYMMLKGMVRSKLEDLFNEYHIKVDSLDLFESLVDSLVYYLFGYCSSLDKAMDWIYENNEDVTVVVMQIQNMTNNAGYRLFGVDINVCDLINLLISIANNYASSFSKYSNRYYYSRITENERVRFIYDDLLDYEDTSDLTEVLRYCFDVYDNNGLHVKSMFTPIYEEAGGSVGNQKYEESLTASYDAIIKLVQYIYTADNTLYYETYSDYKVTIRKFINICSILISDVIQSIKNGNSYESCIESAIDSFEAFDEETKLAVRYYIYRDICGTTMDHPSYEGHRQMADAVISTLEQNQKGMISQVRGIRYAISDYQITFNNIKNYVAENKERITKQITNVVAEKIVSDVKDEISQRLENVFSKIKTIR